MLLVALNYALFGAAGFQKDGHGRMSLAAQVLLAPYLIGAWINSRAWTRHEPRPVEIRDGVWLGRIPFGDDAAGYAAVIDLSAELPCHAGECRAFPMLDLVTPPPDTLRAAAQAIEQAQGKGLVLACCALGFSRSAAAVASWLVMSGRAANVDEAIAQIRKARPRIVLDEAARDAIVAAATS
jgi:hypothetical protein